MASFLFWLLLAFSSVAVAQSVEPPKNVSALVYSSSAVELFWTRAPDDESGDFHRVQVTKNGRILGLLDTDGLFESGLHTDAQLTYELRSLASDGQLSSPVMLSLSTAGFSPPAERVYGVEPSDSSERLTTEDSYVELDSYNDAESSSSIEPPADVSIQVYSSTALELFWSPARAADSGVAYRVQIKRNGELLGQLDARSLYQSDLQIDDQLSYELRSLAPDGQLSSPVVVSVSGSGDEPANGTGQSEDVVEASPVEPQPETFVPVEPVTETETPTPLGPQEPVEIAQGNDNCIARDMSSLLSCVRDANSYHRIDIAQDIQCDDNCCPNGQALLRFNNVSDLHIAGHGKRVLRQVSQRQCSLLEINHSSDLQISDLSLDDDQTAQGCQVAESCARMVQIKGSSNISFDNAHISHGKGYAFYVQGTNGFRFENSSLHNSGVLGMYVGHDDDASSNISITHSVFSDNQTNGLALLGVNGSSITANVVANNTFVRNHRRGQWAVEPQYGTGFTGGGQLYIAQASNVTVRDNLIQDGYCDNCYVQSKHRSGVSGIELGRPNHSSVSNVVLRNNKVINLDGFGISQNNNSPLSNVQLRNNALLNVGTGIHVEGVSNSGNRVLNTQHFDSFENANDLDDSFDSSVSCSSDGSVTRVCGRGSRYGQCAVQLTLSRAECADASVELLGSGVTISAGQMAVASGWVENPIGQWCLVFRDSSGSTLSEQCLNMSDADRSDVQSFVGLPSIDAVAPARSTSVRIRYSLREPEQSVRLDDLKLSVGD